MNPNFDKIRCYNDEEVHETLKRLCEEKQFMKIMSTIYPFMPKEMIKKRLLNVNTQLDFQQKFVLPFVQYLVANITTNGVELYGIEKIIKEEAYLYLSNHRDIVSDPVFLCYKFLENGFDTVEVAIGDNLLIYPWIEDLVRLNKSFIVKRGLTTRQMLESSKLLSEYIWYTLHEKKHSIWMAQREGRAKDSNDKTQESLLKMLNLAGKSSFIENMIELNICPLSISYEYDPCDYLKAKEFQLRRDHPDYKKQPADDIENMVTGILGFKGKVIFHLTGCINEDLKKMENKVSNRNQQIKQVAQLIDRQIYSHYAIFSNNKIAYDALTGENRFATDYSEIERIDFEQYLLKQISKIQLENKDEQFLRTKILEMYAYPLINYLKAVEE
ncbi:MAG: 1-acyl-sn-glycerol-3-phosphate acyltransferase [Paludibacteraceae bacterium]|nr:1-acyl-sn-glycerol-3-phosphate acyltransferase [Paludibacteraceae bacterium]